MEHAALSSPQPALARRSHRAPPGAQAAGLGSAQGLVASLARLLEGHALSSAETQALLAMSQVHEVRCGHAIFSRQELAAHLVWLHQGTAALGCREGEGRFRIERSINAPGWLDQSSAWLGAGHAMDAQAGSLCVVVRWPVAAVRRVVQQFPSLGVGLLGAMAHEVQALSANTHDLMHKDAPARLAAWMLQHCQPLAEDAHRAVLHLQGRKRDLASQLAITPETLSRLMRAFTRDGVIAVAGYTVNVFDVGALRRLAAA